MNRMNESIRISAFTTIIALSFLIFLNSGASAASMWDDTFVPTILSDSDTSAVELGVKFQSSVDGYITGLRFYKSTANTGTHVGNLWTAGGTLLSSVIFTNETASGWQEMALPTPVPITAVTTYVASYHTTVGRYSADSAYFAASGFDNPPLRALADGENGGNGVYLYGAGGFPTQTWNAANYWVDVVFQESLEPDTTPPAVNSVAPADGSTSVAIGANVTVVFNEVMDDATIDAGTFELLDDLNQPVNAVVSYDSGTNAATLNPSAALAESAVYTAQVLGGTSGVTDLAGNPLASTYTWSFTTAAPSGDTTPPVVSSVSPTSDATNVGTGTAVTVTFDEAMESSTISGSTYELRNSSNQLVSATVAYNGTTNTATLTPSAALGNSSTYTARVIGGTGGVTDVAGNALASTYTWSFTTAAAGSSGANSLWGGAVIPAILADSDTSAVELGVKFQSTVGGYITALRFYKSATNTGTHVGNLWNTGGTLLASVTFTNETASGWQEMALPTPVAITANTTYVASYHTNVGRYSADSAYFTSAYDNPPLQAPSSGASGGNGVYRYSAASAFPNQTWNATNYWVDVVFQENLEPDTTPPTVTAVLPLDGTTDVATSTVVTATFSEEMDSATIGGGTFELRDAASAPVAAVISYDNGTNTATLTPSAPLATSVTYTASVLGGIGGVTDSAGNALAATSTWSFTTAAPSGDTTPPTVTAVLPLDGTTDVAASTVVTATFNEEMDSATIGGSTFELRDAASAPVAAVISYDNGTNTATLTPSAPLATSVTYTASVLGGIGGVTDSAGNALTTDYSWSFTTASSSGGDTTPPQVTAFTIPATATTLTVPITTFTASDNVGVTDYLVTETSTTPAPTAAGWSTTTPASYTFTTAGAKTLYAWAKDAAGNVSTSRSATVTITLPSAGPEPAGWYAGDMHVHRSCGGSPISVSAVQDNMDAEDLAVVSLLADMGNGEVQNPVTDLPLVNGQDASVSTPDRIVHWDAEWHWDATYTQFPNQALGGHVVALGLSSAEQIWEEYTYPILEWAHQRGGIAGFAHMQYLDDGIPQDLDCCTPIEYPVEVALGAADFISEDVTGNDSFIRAYYRLLNTGFRPGFAAGSDFPCGQDVGALLTYVQVADGQMTYRNWIDGIAQGRTVVSRNGHNEFLSLTVNGSSTPGDEINLTGGGTVSVAIQWTANQNLSGTVELVKNGVAVENVSRSVSPSSPASLNATVDFTSSGWLAARRMGANGHVVHTAAVFVIVDGAPVRASVADAEFYVQWMNELIQKTSPGGVWNSFFPTDLAAAQERYQAARGVFQQIAIEAGGGSQAPSVISVSPANGATNVGTGTAVTATFSEPMDPATIDDTTFVLRNPSNQVVSATVTYNGTANRATLTPTNPLADSTTYTVTVVGGSNGVTDATGTPMSADYSWSFTTAAAGSSGFRQPVGRHLHPDDPVRFGHQCGGAGRQVSEHCRRVHHGPALLQVGHQHRHAHGSPVECRRYAARQRDLHQRDRLRLAGDGPVHSRGHHGRHDLHRLLPRAGGALLGRLGLLHRRL